MKKRAWGLTIYKNECRRGWRTWAIWTGAIAGMLLMCLALFPQMKEQTEGLTKLFAGMGVFTAAFGMDKLNFGTAMGFYGVECGNVLGIGGGMFAAMLGAGALCREEKERTAEFLLTLPVSRARVVTEKALCALTQVLLLNVVCAGLGAAGFAMIGESLNARDFLLLHAAYLAMQAQLALMCLRLSAFLRGNGLGTGLGLSLAMYFMSLLANLSEKAAFLDYISPYGYAEAADIIGGSLRLTPMLCGAAFALAGAAAAYIRYTRKDIAA